jgi:hypothetical protein
MLKKMTSAENTKKERREENDRPRKRAKVGVLLKLSQSPSVPNILKTCRVGLPIVDRRVE